MRKALTAVITAGVLVAGAFVATAIAGNQPEDDRTVKLAQGVPVALFARTLQTVLSCMPADIKTGIRG